MKKSCRIRADVDRDGDALRSKVDRPDLGRMAVAALTALALALLPTAATASETTLGVAPGPLGVLAIPDLSFPTGGRPGKEQALTTNEPLDLSDATGSGAGWRTTLSATPFDNGAGRTLPADSAAVDGAPDISCDAGSTCIPAATSVSYPLTVPVDGTSTVTILNATSNTGVGNQTVSVPYRLFLPSGSDRGRYTSTWTVTLLSGP